ncbi:unnamed protein product [Blepharisma stoltei]|uniref:Uncharacterized protein n=1 Tax=Blepharisma stoltei TaxID=1481888 RepID=A0AAU9I8V0_9CILI|nr:unnamed protein product [Blepharisma stoltei]
MRSKSTNLSQITLHGNEKPIPKTINLNQMHFHQFKHLNYTGNLDMTPYKDISQFYCRDIYGHISVPAWPYTTPKPALSQKSVKEMPIQLVASKAEQTVSLFQSNRKISLPSIKSKGSLFKDSFNIENKDIERSLYFSRKPRYTDFQPYNLEDFKKINPKNYLMLGGLGPVNVGRDEWVKNTKKAKLVKDYSKSVRDLNIKFEADNISN